MVVEVLPWYRSASSRSDDAANHVRVQYGTFNDITYPDSKALITHPPSQ